MPVVRPLAKAAALFIFFALFAAVAYAPGLHGGFLYDDATSITGNPNIRVAHGHFAEWAIAALSYPSGTPPFRSLTMLSFAANYYISGMNPFGFKLTNLAIHLLNGLLLFCALRSILALRRAASETHDPGDTEAAYEDLFAAAAAGLWLLLPINLTAVLYSVQRLESLAATFVFLGLWWYAHARVKMLQGRGGGFGAWAAVIVCTGTGVLAKETAVALPLYTMLIEFCVSRACKRDGAPSRSIYALYVVTLLVPFLAGMIWMWQRYIADGVLNPNSFVFARFITEFRVILEYITWTVIPSLDTLTLYHDDILLSHGLLDPPTTLLSLAAIVALIGVALRVRKRRPIMALGILWFFAGHLLTGTVIPLILAFEHRNYFSSAGLILAVASAIGLEGGLRGRVLVLVLLAAGLFYGGTTWMRAQEWSDPIRLASSDALKRPRSPAAQFDYAQALVDVARKSRRSDMVDQALRVFERGRHLPGASMTYEQNMIGILAASGLKIPDDVWASMIEKLAQRRPNTNDAYALSRLNHCFITEECRSEYLPKLQEAYAGAMAHSKPLPVLLSVHAEFEWYLEHDHARAEQDMREAVRLAPRDIEGWKNLIVVLIHQGKRDEAEAMIASLDKRNYLGALDEFIDPLRRTLAAAESSSAVSGNVKPVH